MKSLKTHLNESLEVMNEEKKTVVNLLPGQKRFSVHLYDDTNGYAFWSSDEEKHKGFDTLEDAKKYAISKLTSNNYFARIVDNTIWTGTNPLWKHSGSVILSISNKGKTIKKI